MLKFKMGYFNFKKKTWKVRIKLLHCEKVMQVNTLFLQVKSMV